MHKLCIVERWRFSRLAKVFSTSEGFLDCSSPLCSECRLVIAQWACIKVMQWAQTTDHACLHWAASGVPNIAPTTLERPLKGTHLSTKVGTLAKPMVPRSTWRAFHSKTWGFSRSALTATKTWYWVLQQVVPRWHVVPRWLLRVSPLNLDPSAPIALDRLDYFNKVHKSKILGHFHTRKTEAL